MDSSVQRPSDIRGPIPVVLPVRLCCPQPRPQLHAAGTLEPVKHTRHSFVRTANWNGTRRAICAAVRSAGDIRNLRPCYKCVSLSAMLCVPLGSTTASGNLQLACVATSEAIRSCHGRWPTPESARSCGSRWPLLFIRQRDVNKTPRTASVCMAPAAAIAASEHGGVPARIRKLGPKQQDSSRTLRRNSWKKLQAKVAFACDVGVHISVCLCLRTFSHLQC